MKLTPKEAVALAEDIYKAIDEQFYAREIVRLLKKHGLANIKDLEDWAESKKEEGV